MCWSQGTFHSLSPGALWQEAVQALTLHFLPAQSLPFSAHFSRPSVTLSGKKFSILPFSFNDSFPIIFPIIQSCSGSRRTQRSWIFWACAWFSGAGSLGHLAWTVLLAHFNHFTNLTAFVNISASPTTFRTVYIV